MRLNSLITDIDPSSWEHSGKDPDAEYVEEVVQVKVLSCVLCSVAVVVDNDGN